MNAPLSGRGGALCYANAGVTSPSHIKSGLGYFRAESALSGSLALIQPNFSSALCPSFSHSLVRAQRSGKHNMRTCPELFLLRILDFSDASG